MFSNKFWLFIFLLLSGYSTAYGSAFSGGGGGGGSTFAMQADWVNAKNAPYYATGVGNQGTGNTTIAGVCNSGSTSCTLVSAAAFAINGGGVIGSGGAASVDLLVQITGINGNTITFNPALSSTVTNKRVYTDDGVAIKAALASNLNVYLPCGVYNIGKQQTLTFGTPGQSLVGCAWGGFGGNLVSPGNGSYINWRSSTANVIDIEKFSVNVQNLVLWLDNVFKPSTAGAGICLACTAGAAFGYATVQNVTMSGSANAINGGFFYGLHLACNSTFCSSDGIYENLDIANSPATGALIQIDQGSNGYGANIFNNILAQGYNGVPTSAIYISGTDSNRWNNLEVIGGYYNINFNAGASTRILNQTFTNVLIENFTGSGVSLASTNICTTSSGVTGVAFSTFEVNTNPSIVVEFNIGQNVCSTTIENGHFETGNPAGTEAILENGTDSVILGNSITSRLGLPATTGIVIGNTSVNALIVGNKISTAFTNGVECQAGAAGYSIVSNSANASTNPINNDCFVAGVVIVGNQ